MIEVIFGLGNPGKEYELTRHNAGFWFADAVADRFNCAFKKEKKFNAEVASFTYREKKIWLVKPQTFVNRSGSSVGAFCHFYKIATEHVLVAYDELDLPPGSVKLKVKGGHGGHNGLRDIIPRIGAEFARLRIGIGHPGHKSKVTSWVLGRPNKTDDHAIADSIARSLQVSENILDGEIEKAMLLLHTKS